MPYKEDPTLLLLLLGLGAIWLVFRFLVIAFRSSQPENYSKLKPLAKQQNVQSADYSSPLAATKQPIRVVVESKEISPNWETELHFDKGDPQDWSTYHGQNKLKKFLQLQIDVLPLDEGLKLMFIAQKGSGKTTLFRIIGAKLKRKRPSRYIEVTPAILQSKKQIDNLLNWVRPRDIICIDEIHMLSRQVADTLLPAIEDGIHPFEDGMRKLPRSLTWMGATTDVGLLPSALQDRFQILALEPLEHNDLVNILKDQPMSITAKAAEAIALRSIGSPRGLKRVYKVARDIAFSKSDSIITLQHAQEAFLILDLDIHGLYPQDRAVLEALYKHPKKYASGKLRHAHSERAIRALTGLDESLYRDQIEPRLLRQGFITISTGGRELTDKAFKCYFE